MHKYIYSYFFFLVFFIPKFAQSAPCFPKVLNLTVSTAAATTPTIFRNISSAILYAQEIKACRVAIVVEAGNYTEPTLSILDIDASIIGAGPNTTHTNLSLRNRTGRSLTISKISFKNSSMVSIVQSGGKLKIDNVYFQGTTLDAGDIRTGSALLLTRGAQGNFRFVSFKHNLGGAIRAGQNATAFYCGGCIFENNQVHPLAIEDGADSRELMGSISLYDGALASIDLSHFSGNQMAAIQAKNALIYLRNSTVASSVAIGRLGGMGMLLQDGSQAIGERVRFINQPLTGISIFSSRLSLRRSIVQGNTIGMSVRRMEAGLEYFRCIEDTIFRDNQTNLDADRLPVPPPTIPGRPVPAPPARCPNWTFPTSI